MNKKVVLSVLSATVVASMAASAFAAPKSGLYIGGNVDKFYSFDTLFDITPGALTQFTNEIGLSDFNNLIYVDFDGKGASLQEIMAATDFNSVKKDLTSDKFEGEYSLVKPDGTSSEKYDPRKDSIDTPAGELKVESVSAINGASIAINFNQAVSNASGALYNATTGVLSGNITITNLGSAPALTAANLIGSLSEDGKTLTITTNSATEKFDGQYAINIAADVIASKNDKDVLLPEYNGTVTVKDTTAPGVSKVEYGVDTANVGKYKAIVTFTEPLASEGTVSLNGSAIVAPAYTFTAGKNTLEVNNLDAGTSYTLAVTGATDKAGNYISPNPTTKTLTVPGDDVKPTVTVSASKSVLTFKFSERLGEQDLDATAEGAGNEEHAKVTINGNVVYLDATNQDAADPTKYTYDATALIAGSFLNTSVKVESFKDLAGNAGTAVTQNVTLTKDTAAPKFVSASVVDDKFIVKFDEDAEPVGLTTVDVKYTDADNVVTSVAGATLNAAGVVGNYDANNNGVIDGDEENYIVLPVTQASLLTGGKLKAGSYEVTIAQGAVRDTVVPTATTSAIKFTATASSTASKAIVELNAATTDQVVGMPGVIEAVFNNDMSSTALTAGNYKLDGVAIPSTSKLYFNADKQHVRIELPKGFVTVSGNRQFTVSNLTDLNGNTLRTGYTSDTINLTENVAPVATSASLVDDNNVTVTFGENLGGIPTTGIELWVNNAKVTLDGVTPFAISNNVLTIKTDAAVLLKSTDTIVVKFVDGNDVVDANGNVVAAASVTVH